jgi:hypothetical protein
MNVMAMAPISSHDQNGVFKTEDADSGSATVPIDGGFVHRTKHAQAEILFFQQLLS